MSNDFFKQLSKKYPFITVVMYGRVEYVGIVQNRDQLVTTMYDFGRIVDLDLKQTFLQLAETWWWESNRSIPINIFLRDEWSQFKPYLQTFINKDLLEACQLKSEISLPHKLDMQNSENYKEITMPEIWWKK